MGIDETLSDLILKVVGVLLLFGGFGIIICKGWNPIEMRLNWLAIIVGAILGVIGVIILVYKEIIN